MSANPALSHSPAELEAFLARTEERLQVLKQVRDLRRRRASLLEAIRGIDGELEDSAEPLRLALLDAPAPLPELPAPAGPEISDRMLGGLRRYAIAALLPEQLLLAEVLALAAWARMHGARIATSNVTLGDLQQCAEGWCGAAALIP